MTQFSLSLFEVEAKEAGMDSAADHYPDALRVARNIAVDLASERGSITIDDVRGEFERRSIPFVAGNWMGSVFKGKEWIACGIIPATHTGSHGRFVRRWSLKHEQKSTSS
jgi:hypothetical protein